MPVSGLGKFLPFSFPVDLAVCFSISTAQNLLPLYWRGYRRKGTLTRALAHRSGKEPLLMCQGAWRGAGRESGAIGLAALAFNSKNPNVDSCKPGQCKAPDTRRGAHLYRRQEVKRASAKPYGRVAAGVRGQAGAWGACKLALVRQDSIRRLSITMKQTGV